MPISKAASRMCARRSALRRASHRRPCSDGGGWRYSSQKRLDFHSEQSVTVAAKPAAGKRWRRRWSSWIPHSVNDAVPRGFLRFVILEIEFFGVRVLLQCSFLRKEMSRIRRTIGSPASERAFQASQSPCTLRQVRLTMSLLTPPPNSVSVR